MVVAVAEPVTEAFFFAGSHAGAAELKLAYALDRGLEVAVVVGDSGLGKTTLLRRLAARAVAAGDVVADVFFPRLDVDDLLAFLDAELEGRSRPTSLRSGEGREARLRRIAEHARRLADDGRGVVVAIDDAHLVRDACVFEALHLLLNLREREQARFTIVLAGQKPLLTDLARQTAFAQRIGITATLAPFDAAATADYVRERLRSGSPEDADRFDAAALVALHDHSGGVPRRIDRLCEMSLIVASSNDRQRITSIDVDQVAGETGLLNGDGF